METNGALAAAFIGGEEGVGWAKKVGLWEQWGCCSLCPRVSSDPPSRPKPTLHNRCRSAAAQTPAASAAHGQFIGAAPVPRRAPPRRVAI